MMWRLLAMCKVPLTDAFAIFKEGESSMPGVQVNAYDGSLTKPRWEVHFVTIMMQQP